MIGAISPVLVFAFQGFSFPSPPASLFCFLSYHFRDPRVFGRELYHLYRNEILNLFFYWTQRHISCILCLSFYAFCSCEGKDKAWNLLQNRTQYTGTSFQGALFQCVALAVLFRRLYDHTGHRDTVSSCGPSFDEFVDFLFLLPCNDIDHTATSFAHGTTPNVWIHGLSEILWNHTDDKNSRSPYALRFCDSLGCCLWHYCIHNPRIGTSFCPTNLYYGHTLDVYWFHFW